MFYERNHWIKIRLLGSGLLIRKQKLLNGVEIKRVSFSMLNIQIMKILLVNLQK